MTHLFRILGFGAVYGAVDLYYFTPARERWQNVKSIFTVTNPFTIMARVVIALVIAMIVFFVCDYYICRGMGWI